jgi:hypothetical protein
VDEPSPGAVLGWALVLLAALSISACTMEEIYTSGRDWQRSQCVKILDQAEYDRCMRDADLAYDAYKEQKELEEK